MQRSIAKYNSHNKTQRITMQRINIMTDITHIRLQHNRQNTTQQNPHRYTKHGPAKLSSTKTPWKKLGKKCCRYPGFCSMKQLRVYVLLLPLGWDASPSQGYPQQYVAGIHLYTWVETDKCGVKFLV